MKSSPLAAARASDRPRPGDHSSRLIVSALSCVLAALLAGCEDDREGPDAGGDAGQDSGVDARTDEGEAGSPERDSGHEEDNESCGKSRRRNVFFDRNGTRVIGDNGYRHQFYSEGTVNATVIALEAPTPSGDGSRRAHLRAGADTFLVGALDVSTLGVEVGDSVELSWSHAENVHPPDHSRLSLRVSDRLAFFYMQSGRDLPEGFSSEWGEVQCRGTWLCATWTSKKLRVTGPCGDTVEVGTDGVGGVCDYEVLAGSLQHMRPEYRDNLCDDHGRAGIEVAIVHTAVGDDGDAGR